MKVAFLRVVEEEVLPLGNKELVEVARNLVFSNLRSRVHPTQHYIQLIRDKQFHIA